MVDEVDMLKKKLIIFKMDFENAYDFVELEFVDEMLNKMNFLVKWQK